MSNNPIPLFLFSLPRSGSTLLQRILAIHSEIVSAVEPHILLPFLFASKDQDVYSKYDHTHVAEAVRYFFHTLPNGSDDYSSELRDFILRLYTRAAGKGAKYFLDKTPKYSLVSEEIIRLFPEGKFIFLWRNPLSAIASFMETWFDGRWLLHHADFEMFQGLTGLTDAYKKSVQRVYALRYEDLILNPEATLRPVCDYLKIPFSKKMLTHFTKVKLGSRFRDPHSELEHYQVLRQDPLQKWENILNNPLRKRWCLRYLNWIGKERLAVMGYDLDNLIANIETLPSTGRYLVSDMFWMPLGIIARVFESEIFKQKLRAYRKGERIYMHK
jgi:hypothetical protein